jgi:hypothetical protein
VLARSRGWQCRPFSDVYRIRRSERALCYFRASYGPSQVIEPLNSGPERKVPLLNGWLSIVRGRIRVAARLSRLTIPFRLGLRRDVPPELLAVRMSLLVGTFHEQTNPRNGWRSPCTFLAQESLIADRRMSAGDGSPRSDYPVSRSANRYLKRDIGEFTREYSAAVRQASIETASTCLKGQ